MTDGQEPTPHTNEIETNPSAATVDAEDSTIATNALPPTVRGRFALALIVASVILADATLYKTEGYFGPAVFFLGTSVILFLGIPRRRFSLCVGVLSAMMIMLCIRLASNGFAMQVLMGLWLLCALALALRGRTPFVLEALAFGFQSVPGGAEFFQGMNERVKREVLEPMESREPSKLVEVILPAFAAILFGGIFVMANPDMVGWVSGQLSDIFRAISRFFSRFSPMEVLFWISVAWVTGGLLRPVVGPLITGTEGQDGGAWGSASSPLYKAYRNTLLTVIGLFIVYLNFESRAFMSRKPPEGFTYSSYAHEGAAWLTIALMLATVMLSLIFRGRTLADPRIGRLRTLAWIWSALNILLAVAVYNRMMIYIEYNGMTRMRVIGILGITSVVGGFAMVVLKIRNRRDFLWLIRRQLWVLGMATFIYQVLPVDSVIHRYNVRQINGGNEAPIVQITEHPIDDEALPRLLPLCNSEDDRIRDGICALVALKHSKLQQSANEADASSWTAWQKSRDDALRALNENRDLWDVHPTPGIRNEAFNKLKDYAFRTWW